MWYIGADESAEAKLKREISAGGPVNEADLLERTSLLAFVPTARTSTPASPPSPPSPRSNPTFLHRLNEKMEAGNHTFVSLFGSVPPRANLSIAKAKEFARSFAGSMLGLGLDGIIVYDIQDEPGRDPTLNRPFAYAATHAPTAFARMLSMYSGLETVVYHGVSTDSSDSFSQWMSECWDVSASRTVVLVGAGSAAEKPALSVQDAAQVMRNDESRAWLCGGIFLPERHRDKADEHDRIAAKVAAGARFFTSQVIFNADVAIWTLRDYDERCKATGERPARLIFTFAPFARPDTAIFLRWLGVEIPLGTEKRVLSRATRELAMRECLDLCRENLKRILYAIEFYSILVPIGISVESVSKYRDEFVGAVELFRILHEEMSRHFERRRLNALNAKWWPAATK